MHEEIRKDAPICPQCGAVYGTEARFCPADGSKLASDPVDPLVGQLLEGQIRVEAGARLDRSSGAACSMWGRSGTGNRDARRGGAAEGMRSR